jgi:DNA invertase Pin-like site-specific DNA recombinase
MSDMTKAIGYARVSTQEQAEHGVSIDAQVAKIRAYAELYDLELVDVVVDAGVSAKTLDRPGLTAVLQALDNGEAEAVVIFKLDRLTRSVVDWNILVDAYFGGKAKGVLLSVSEQVDPKSAAGRLCLNMLMSVTQWEREAIGERTKAAMAHRQACGQHVGSPAFGYEMISGELKKKICESEIVALIQQLKSEGLKLQAIADELNAQGIQTKRGCKWQGTQVKRVLARGQLNGGTHPTQPTASTNQQRNNHDENNN